MTGWELVGLGAGSYLWSYISHDEHQRETGILAGEAVINSLLTTTQALKYSFGRQRPTADQGELNFFKGGDSFPSDHAAVAWSAATVIAHEYPGFLTKTSSLWTGYRRERIRCARQRPLAV